MPDLDDGIDARVTMEPAFNTADLRCFADPSDTTTYYFLPSRPDLQRDSEQRPMVTMVDVGPSAFLMFTATWIAKDESVEALRRDIARSHHAKNASRVRLAFAPLASLKCHALLGDGSGSFQPIATSATSGVPPYAALFNLSVAGERLANVRRAVHGEAGFLVIEYVADLLLPFGARAAFHSQRDLLPWLRARQETGTPMRALLEEAVASGLATVTMEASDRYGAEAATELQDRVLSRAAQIAPRWIAEGGDSELDVQVELERAAREPVRAFADIGSILARGAGH